MRNETEKVLRRIEWRNVFYEPTWYGRRYLRGGWVLAGFAIGAFIVCATIFGLAVAADRHSCYATGTAMHHETEYPSVFTGCLIRTRAGWVPMDKWRTVKVTR